MASPALSQENSEERIICRICNTIFNDPRLLSCHHTFCLTCLGELMEDHPGDFKVSCPLCKAYTVLPKGGIRFLPSDNKAKRLCEKINKGKRESMSASNKQADTLPDLKSKLLPECNRCQSGAKFLCVDCEQALCQKCKEEHESEILRNYDDHYLLALRKEFHCNFHTGSLVTGICSDCKKSLCPICTRKHKKGHDVLKLKMHSHYRTKLKTEIDALSSRIHSFEIALAETQKMLAFYTDVIGSVRSTFSDISTKVMTKIMALEEECLINIQRACKKHSEHLNLEFLDDMTSNKMQHLVGDIRHAMASPPDHCLLMFKELCYNSHELRCIQVPEMNIGKMLDKLRHDDLMQPTLDYFLEELNSLFGCVRNKIEKLSQHSRQRLEELDMWHLENAEFAELDIDGMCSDSDSDNMTSCPSVDCEDTDLHFRETPQ